MYYLRSSLAVFLLIVLFCGQPRAAVDTASATAAVQELLELEGQATPSAEGERLRSFYALRSYEAAWWSDRGWRPEVRAALLALTAADRQGLMPADYQPQRLASVLEAAAQGDAGLVAAADLQLSAAVLRYLDHAINGRIDPTTVAWRVTYQPYPVEILLADALGSGRIESWLADAGPQTAAYRALRDLHAQYRALATVDWPHLPDGPTLARGDEGAPIAILRRQLMLLGDLAEPSVPVARQSSPEQRMRAGEPATGLHSPYYLPASVGSGWRETAEVHPGDRQGRAARSRPAAAPARFDAQVEAAVRRFQERHGLNPDGRVGADTRAALNVSPAQRLDQIGLNLERLRWMPTDLGERYVMVNIPAFQLTAVEQGRAVLRMPVVVGEPDWQTPVLSDEIVDLKFAPTWTVPSSILRQEMLGQIRRDPSYIERKGLRVFRNGREISPWDVDWSMVSAGSGYVLRQDPGPRNALGRIRFSLTNPYDIYLHDTPTTQAFRKINRALSHGCIRVAQPEELALFVLAGDPAWDRARIERAMNASRTNVHALDRPVPVYLVYFTAWVDENGVAQFRDDIYGRDEALAAALQRRPGRTPPAI